jgi:hypothetical protein
MATQIEEIIDANFDEYVWTYDEVLQVLRNISASIPIRDDQSDLPFSCIERYCRALIGDQFSDSFEPPREDRPALGVCIDFLKSIWSSTKRWNELEESADILFHPRLYLDYCHLQLVGRCFFRGTDGCIGVAPIGTLPGDSVSVLLGCTFPVVLRPSSSPKTISAWQVVGVCYAEGLMKGEAIYGDKLPSHYRPVSQTDRYSDLIDGYDYALHDSRAQTFRTDPAEVLTEMGFNVESYQRAPHVLEVLPEILRDAGVSLQDFFLV